MSFRFVTFAGLLGGIVMLAATPYAHAAPSVITYTYDHHIFTVSSVRNPQWKQVSTQWYYEGKKAVPPVRFLTASGATAEPGWSTRSTTQWDTQAIAQTLREQISATFDRPAGTVRISKNATGAVVFDGIGLPGRTVNLSLAAELTKKALEQDIATITLPIDITQPTIVVADEELKRLGIKEVVTVGESSFTGSPVNRRHNIAVGIAKFNGHIIPQGSLFSFNEVLGPVNAKTGYRKELVIQGELTIPDYGGGLCQVSSTAYRGPWEYGLPIVERHNHSYAVTYYSPKGTDATIYPPNVDLTFTNDTPGALLIQALVDEKSRAYFIYYGTQDNRNAEVFGPYIFNSASAPKEERIVYTKDLKPGERKKVGERHDGMDAVWYRSVHMPGSGHTLETYFSSYQVRPLYYQVGTETDQLADTDNVLSSEPSWFPSNE